jgi:acylphosphatase
MSICKKCLVSGRVQGVFYRASAQQQAQKFDVTGYAINLADGRVEVFACGEVDKVEKLTGWLWTGPSGSEVNDVICELVEDIPPACFTTA